MSGSRPGVSIKSWKQCAEAVGQKNVPCEVAPCVALIAMELFTEKQFFCRNRLSSLREACALPIRGDLLADSLLADVSRVS